MTSTISPTMAAQAPTVEGQVEVCELGHIPMAIPIPSGIAKRTISRTSRTIRSVLVTTPECIPEGNGWPSSRVAGGGHVGGRGAGSVSVEVAAGVVLIVAPLWFNSTFAHWLHLLPKPFPHVKRPGWSSLRSTTESRNEP